MSYWVYLEIDTGSSEPTEIWSRNITSNLAPMWTEAGAPLAEWNGHPAMYVYPHLSNAVHAMRSDPERFQALNPPNGWGDYDGCLSFLEAFRDACREHSKCTIRVSR